MIKYGKMKILKNKHKSKISIYEQVNIARKKFRLYNSYVFNVKFFRKQSEILVLPEYFVFLPEFRS